MAEAPSTQATADPGGNGGTVLSRYLDAELNAEQARCESLERRGLALITVSGVLTTLLLALPSALAHPQRFAPSAPTQAAALVALTGFVLTVAAAVSISLPRHTRLVATHSLLAVAQDSWWRPSDEILQRIFGTKAEQLRQAQTANDRRGRLLLVASVCLSVAIGSLAVLAAFLIMR